VLVTLTPANGTAGVLSTAATTSVVAYGNVPFTGITATGRALCNGVATTTSAPSLTNDSVRNQVSVAVTSSGMPSSTGCAVTVTLTAIGEGGTTTLDTVVNFTTANWWPPQNVAKMETAILGSTFVQVPAGCTSVKLQCFKDYVFAGKAVIAESSAKMVGAFGGRDVRPIVFAGIVTPTGQRQILNIFSYTGDLVSSGADIDFGIVPGGLYDFRTNNLGYIVRATASAQCYQWRWYPPSTTGSSNGWGFQEVTCPR